MQQDKLFCVLTSFKRSLVFTALSSLTSFRLELAFWNFVKFTNLSYFTCMGFESSNIKFAIKTLVHMLFHSIAEGNMNNVEKYLKMLKL